MLLFLKARKKLEIYVLGVYIPANETAYSETEKRRARNSVGKRLSAADGRSEKK